MTHEQLENCYRTVLKQRDDAETKLQLLVNLIDKRAGDLPEHIKEEFLQKLSELGL